MNRRTFMAGAGAMLAVSSAARGQPATKTWRIGHLSLVSETHPQYKNWFAAFREGLRKLGYVEGENVVFEHRYAAGQVDRLPALAAELARLRVDVIVAAPAGSASVARKATTTVPIVFMGEPDPVGTGLVASLGRPGGNVTGLADAHGDLAPKRLDLLKQIVPAVSRVGVLWNPSNSSVATQLQAIESAASGLGLTVVAVGVKGPGGDEVDRAFARMAKERVGSLVVISDPTLGIQRDRIAALSIERRLPASGTHRGWAEGGLLMSYGTSFVEMFRSGAVLVDRILKGASPAQLPVEQPTKFDLVFNTRTAKALGLTIPPALLLQADEVI